MRALLPTLCLLPALALAGGIPLDDAELADVSGQQGVLINLKLRNNIASNGAHLGCTAVVGAPNPCRIGLEFAARTGTWLMLKEFYGTFQINELRLDVGTLPGAATAYANPARFDANGNAGCTTPLLPSCTPRGLTTLILTYPGADSPSTYEDFLSFSNIGRIWLEFDQASPAVSGSDRDTTLNSMFSPRLSDSRFYNEPAHMRFRGTSYVYGF